MYKEMTESITLPAYAHAKYLECSCGDKDCGRIIIWTDRAESRCYRCDQEIGKEENECPVQINNEQIEEFDRQHSCGAWLAIDWFALPPTGDEEYVLMIAKNLVEDLEEEKQRIRSARKNDLECVVDVAVVRLNEPLEEGETISDRVDEITITSSCGEGVTIDKEDPLRITSWSRDPVGEDSEGIWVTSEPQDILKTLSPVI